MTGRFVACGLAASLSLCLAVRPAAAIQKASYRHYLKALMLSNQGEYAAALNEYEAALQLDQDSAVMYEQAAELALDMGETARALLLAERFVEISSGNAQAHFLVGNIYWAQGNFEKARSSFEKTLELKPDFAEALYTMGNLLSSQSPEKARGYFQEYLALGPENASDAEFQLALLEQREGNEDQAIAYLRSAIESDPDNMHAHYTLAQIYEVRRDTVAALEVYGAILSRDPRNTALLNHVGEIRYLLEDVSGARELFLRAKEVLPSDPATCLWLALLAEQEGDFAAAAKSIQASSALGEEASLSLRLSYYLTQDDRLKEAMSVLETAHAKWPKSEEVAYFLALGYDDLKQTPQAVALMKEVLTLRPDHRDARFQLGALYEKQGDMVNTEVQFREILKGNPDDASALNFLGYSLADRNIKLDDAERMILRAVELHPDSGAYIDSLGWIHFRKGRIEEALEELRRAARLMPRDDAVWSHLAEVYEAKGDMDAAWLAWKRSQVFDPRKDKYKKESVRLEEGFSPEKLAQGYQEFLGHGLGNIASYGGPCAISGVIGGKKFSFSGILHYKAPWDLTVDVLGPFFVPIFGVAVRQDGFEMGTLDLEGVSQELLREKLYEAVTMMRDFLEGRLLQGDSSQYKAGWRKPRIVTSQGTLYMNKERTRVAAVQSLALKGFTLKLSEYQPVDGHWIPQVMSLVGQGFSLEFRLSNLHVTFDPYVSRVPQAD